MERILLELRLLEGVPLALLRAEGLAAARRALSDGLLQERAVRGGAGRADPAGAAAGGRGGAGPGGLSGSSRPRWVFLAPAAPSRRRSLGAAPPDARFGPEGASSSNAGRAGGRCRDEVDQFLHPAQSSGSRSL